MRPPVLENKASSTIERECQIAPFMNRIGHFDHRNRVAVALHRRDVKPMPDGDTMRYLKKVHADL